MPATRSPETPGRHECLLSELVVPMHAHREQDDHFVSLASGRARAVSAAEAARDAARSHGIGNNTSLTDVHPDGPVRLPRRSVLRGGVAALGAMLAPHARPRYAFAEGTAARDTVVAVFLRGGMDGLSALVPLDDPAYQAARGALAVRPELAVPLTDRFGLHPALSPLHPLFTAGDLALLTGVGGPWASRSHFRDQTSAERCAPAQVRSGWLGRHLAAVSSDTGTVRAITIGARTTLALATTFPTVATWSIDGFDVPAAAEHRDECLRALRAMYADADGPVEDQALAAFAGIDALNGIRGVPYAPAAEADYPDGPFGSGLREVARLMKSGVALEAACVDLGDWDMHQEFGMAEDATAKFSTQCSLLSRGIAAFRADLGDLWQRTTLLTMSEFGRRVAPGGTGFDHGTGGLMMVAGGGVRGGQILGSQPSVSPDNLTDGDLPVTLDVRQPLAEIVRGRLNGVSLDVVFPGFTPGPDLGLVDSTV